MLRGFNFFLRFDSRLLNQSSVPPHGRKSRHPTVRGADTLFSFKMLFKVLTNAYAYETYETAPCKIIPARKNMQILRSWRR